MNIRSVLYVIALTLLLFFGTWLRFDNLGQQGLWDDELFSANVVLRHPLLPEDGQPWLRRASFSALHPGDTFWTVKGADQSPPLFELAAKLCVPVLGDGEAALRTPSALPSALVLVWLAACAWRRRDAPDAAAWAALLALTASSWLLVTYAQEARTYSLGAALVLPLIVRFWQRVAHGWQQAALPGKGEALLGAAACLAHYNAAVLVALLWCAYGALAYQRRDMAAITRLAVAPLTLIVWLWVAHTGFRAGSKGHVGWIPHMNYGQSLALLGNELGAQALGWPATATLTAVCVLALCIRIASRKNTSPSMQMQGRALLALLALAMLMFALLSGIVMLSRIWHPRHLIFLLPVLYTVAAAALALLAVRWKALALVLAAVLLVVQLPALQHLPVRKQEDYRNAAARVMAHLHDGDILLLGAIAYSTQPLEYYAGARSGRTFRLRALGSVEEAADTCLALEGERVGVIAPSMHLPALANILHVCNSRYEARDLSGHGVLAHVLTLRPQPAN